MRDIEARDPGSATSPDELLDPAAALSDMLGFLTLESAGEGHWRGRPAHESEGYVFGGMVIAQATATATREVPSGTRLHSLHAYFLRPVAGTRPVDYEVEDVRSGRSFTARRLRASQEGRTVLEMSFSLTADTDGYVYDLPPAEAVPPPEALVPGRGPGPWESAWIGPTEPRRDGTRESTHRSWCRIPLELPTDIHLHTALIGFVTDWTGTGGRPLLLDGHPEGMVSLDHAVWFHRPARADDWLCFDVQSLVNAGGRGLVRGVIRDPKGLVVASMAQEMRLTPPAG